MFGIDELELMFVIACGVFLGVVFVRMFDFGLQILSNVLGVVGVGVPGYSRVLTILSPTD
ncbi:MAG: hypothetical protein WAO12_02405 [Venatoribacter sp.]